MLDAPPTVRYDHGHLTRMGVFRKNGVPSLRRRNGRGRYFLRRGSGAEYRAGEGTEPSDDGL